MRKLPLLLAASSLTLATALSAVAQNAVTPDMAMLDPDTDGSVDMEEAKNAANAVWTKINPDGDDTLEPDELTGRLEGDDFTAANPDGDQTIEQDEWTALIEARFAAADGNSDGAVTTEEFGSEGGQKLLTVLQ